MKKMSGKVITFEKDESIYLDLAEEAADEGRFADAVSYAYTAWKNTRSKEAAKELGFLYADMKLYALSDKYWFYYLEKAKEGEAYLAFEELMLNNIYKGDNLLVDYYFKERIERPGKGNRNDFGEKLAGLAMEKKEFEKPFRIVYPPEQADFTIELENARQNMCLGRFGAALKLLVKIPEGARQYKEALKEIAIVYFELKQEEEASETCKQILSEFGEDAVAYGILSRICFIKDKKRSAYLYEKAMNLLDIENIGDVVKLASCAIEQSDFIRSAELLEKILKEAPFNTEMLLSYSQALINSGEYEKAKESLKTLVRIDSSNVVYKYYLELCSALISGERGDELPVSIEEGLPIKREKEIKKILASIHRRQKESGEAFLKKESVKDALKEGACCGNYNLAHECVSVLACMKDPDARAFCSDMLMDEKIDSDIKRVIVYLRILEGGKKKIAFSTDGVFVKLKTYKLLCEEKNPELYVPYAYVLSKLTPVEESEQKRLAITADRILSAFADDSIEYVREISALITAEFLKDRITLSGAAEMFGVDEESVRRVIEKTGIGIELLQNKKRKRNGKNESKNN